MSDFKKGYLTKKKKKIKTTKDWEIKELRYVTMLNPTRTALVSPGGLKEIVITHAAEAE